MECLAIFCFISNIAAFALMGLDKARAGRGKRRVSEKALFFFPVLGGALGGLLGMMMFHHKTRKWYFVWGFFLLALGQALAAVAWKAQGCG